MLLWAASYYHKQKQGSRATSHWHESTHPHTNPPSCPPIHPPTNSSPHQPTHRPCTTAVQQYVQQQTDAHGSAPTPYLGNILFRHQIIGMFFWGTVRYNLVFRTGFHIFTLTAAMWLRLDSAHRGCPLPEQAHRPETTDNNLSLAGVAVWWWWWWWWWWWCCSLVVVVLQSGGGGGGGGGGRASVEWVYTKYASKHTTCCVPRGPGEGSEYYLLSEWVLGFSRTHTEECCYCSSHCFVTLNELRQSTAAGSREGTMPRKVTCYLLVL